MTRSNLFSFSFLLACLLVVCVACESPADAQKPEMPSGPETTVVEETHRDGSKKVVARYVGDVKVGLKEYYANGVKKQEGDYNASGERDGDWTFWYKDGKLNVECGYRNGLKHGRHTVYYDNGFKRFEGKHREDNRIGVWQFWDDKGKLEKKFDYNRGGIQIFPEP